MLRQTLHLSQAVMPSRSLQVLTTTRSLALYRSITTTTTTSSTTSSEPSSGISTIHLTSASFRPITTAESAPAANQPQYLVSRTPAQNLPIYLRAKRGGNLKSTVLKKIEGDVGQLKADMIAVLGLEDKQIKINHVTRHIEIKGHRRDDVERYLVAKGF